MSNNHLITKNIGNLRGFSTDSIFIRPPNVATNATNLQRAPDRTLQLRRGYQCQIAQIGGMGVGTFDDPASDTIRTVCVGMDGFLYDKLTKQIMLYYGNTVSGVITGISNSNPAVVTSVANGLQTGAVITIRNVTAGSPPVTDYILNNNQFTITRIDADNFSLNGVDSSNTTDYPPYVTGGVWSISFTENRILLSQFMLILH